jgi:hypothetical protein
MNFVPRFIGVEDALGKIHALPEHLSKAIKQVFDVNDLLLVTHIRQDLMQGGTNDTQLQSRTGALSQSTRILPAKVTDGGSKVSGGVNFGQKYARVHIGPVGQVTTIRPVNKQWLTIPLEAAKTGAGALRGGATSSIYRETFIAKGIIFGKLGTVKVAGKTQGKIVPLFILKKEVKVKARLHPSDMFAWLQPKIVDSIREIIALYKNAKGYKI